MRALFLQDSEELNMSKQPVDTRDIKLPDLTSPIIRPGGTELPYQPTQHQTYQERAEQARAARSEGSDWSGFLNSDAFNALSIIFLIFALYLAIKGAWKLYNVAKSQGRATVVFSLFLGIRGARRVSGAAKSIWGEAKAVDKRVTEAERPGPQ